jgi:hypothetical protein
MSALNGQSISQLFDSNGNLRIAVVIFWDQTTGLLRNANYTTQQDGVKNGCIIGDNPTNTPVDITIVRPAGGSHTITIPARSGAVTVAQVASQPWASNPPMHDDVNGWTFALS